MTLCVCLTEDPRFRRLVRRSLAGVGMELKFWSPGSDSDEALQEAGHADIVFLDRTTVDLGLLDRLSGAGQVVVVDRSENWPDAIDALWREGCENLLCRDAPLEEDELVVTSLKLATGDIFGLEKYLVWGTPIHEIRVETYDEKRQAIEELARFARFIGCRRHVVSRIEVVADELLMNALYDAPAAGYGVDRSELLRRAVPGGGPVSDKAVAVRFGADGRFLALSVTDEFGCLTKEAVLKNLTRASRQRGTPLRDPSSGAGLGLYFVAQSVSRLVVNVRPGQATEVVCLFDIRRSRREQVGSAHSLSFFVERVDLRPAAAGSV